MEVQQGDGQQESSTGLPKPETLSPQRQKNEIRDSIGQLHESFGKHVVTRIGTRSGSEVLIFNSTPREGADDHPTIAQAGFHPDFGPMVVTKGDLGSHLGKVIEANKEGDEIPNIKWEDIQEESGSGNKSEVRTILPTEQKTWDSSLISARELARHAVENEKRLAQVLPDSVNAVRTIVEVSELQTPSVEALPPSTAADEARIETHDSGEPPLRPVPPIPSTAPVSSTEA